MNNERPNTPHTTLYMNEREYIIPFHQIPTLEIQSEIGQSHQLTMFSFQQPVKNTQEHNNNFVQIVEVYSK